MEAMVEEARGRDRDHRALSDRWLAFLALLLMAGAIVGARALLHATSRKPPPAGTRGQP